MEGEERILSAKKREKFLSNLAKKRVEHSKLQRKRIFVYAKSSKLGCFRGILVKNSTQINSPIVASVAVITSLGKHVVSEEFIQGNNALG